MKVAYTSPMGLEVSKGDWEGAEWTITGYPRDRYTVLPFESAYDFEEFVQDKFDCKGITFDSEYSQFFAYAKTDARATKLVKDIEKHFEKLRDLAGRSVK